MTPAEFPTRPVQVGPEDLSPPGGSEQALGERSESEPPTVDRAESAVASVASVVDDTNPQVTGAGGLLGCPPPTTVASVVGVVDDPEAARPFFERMKSSESSKQRKRAKSRARVFSIMQYVHHPDTGEIMITEAQIKRGLDEHRSIRRHAYAYHDQDRWDEEDVKHNSRAVLGELKPPHWHIVIECEDAYEIRQIADWFLVPSARVKVPKELDGCPNAGAGARDRAFWFIAQYLTHESARAQHKHPYGREIVRSSMDDYGSQLDDFLAKLARGRGGSSARLDELMLAVMNGDLTLREVRLGDPVMYGRNIDRFRKWRADYLLNQPPPRTRVNHFIGGAEFTEQLGRTGSRCSRGWSPYRCIRTSILTSAISKRWTRPRRCRTTLVSP